MNTITWVKADFEAEIEEFQRVVLDFFGKGPVGNITMHISEVKPHIEYLKALYQKEHPEPLRDNTWRTFIDSESWSTTNISLIYDAMKANGEQRNLERIIKQFIDGKVSAPIGLRDANKKLECVAGNTRLMLARALKIVPKIVIIDTNWTRTKRK